MTYIIQAPQQINSTIQLPASKSICNRALVIHAMAGCTFPLSHLSDCDDTEVIVAALRDMPETINIKIPQSGMYTFALRYANGNGPVNTENKAAIRTLMLNGSKRGTFVMPQRGVGNWDDWGMSNRIQVPLTAGTYTVGITYRPENENMNINTNHALLDQLVVEKAK